MALIKSAFQVPAEALRTSGKCTSTGKVGAKGLAAGPRRIRRVKLANLLGLGADQQPARAVGWLTASARLSVNGLGLCIVFVATMSHQDFSKVKLPIFVQDDAKPMGLLFGGHTLRHSQPLSAKYRSQESPQTGQWCLMQ